MIPTGQSLSLALRVNAYTNAKSYAVALTCSFPHQPSHSTPTKLYTLITLIQAFCSHGEKVFHCLIDTILTHSRSCRHIWCFNCAKDLKVRLTCPRGNAWHKSQTSPREMIEGTLQTDSEEPRDQSKWRAHLFWESSIHSKKKHKSTAGTH